MDAKEKAKIKERIKELQKEQRRLEKESTNYYQLIFDLEEIDKQIESLKRRLRNG